MCPHRDLGVLDRRVVMPVPLAVVAGGRLQWCQFDDVGRGVLRRQRMLDVDDVVGTVPVRCDGVKAIRIGNGDCLVDLVVIGDRKRSHRVHRVDIVRRQLSLIKGHVVVKRRLIVRVRVGRVTAVSHCS